MKSKIASLLVAASLPAAASVTLNTQFGVAFNSSGVAVPDGTLWALVVDTDANNTFTGFGLDGSLNAANVTTPGIADSFFTAGQSLSLGSLIGGNTVFAMGAFNGTANGVTGLAIETLILNYGVNGTAASRNYAFYWFPGSTFTGGASELIGSQVGGIHASGTDGIFDRGMVLPPDGALENVGAATAGGGGSISNSAFTAVNLVPEPSAALLGALGALGLLRRRRI